MIFLEKYNGTKGNSRRARGLPDFYVRRLGMPFELGSGDDFWEYLPYGLRISCFAKYALASFSKDTVVVLAIEIWLSFDVVRGEVYLHRLHYRSKQ